MLGMTTDGNFRLQATLAAGSSCSVLLERGEAIHPHHPITCDSKEIALYEDGSMSCDHAKTGPADLRTYHTINGSIAYLILELASNL